MYLKSWKQKKLEVKKKIGNKKMLKIKKKLEVQKKGCRSKIKRLRKLKKTVVEVKIIFVRSNLFTPGYVTPQSNRAFHIFCFILASYRVLCTGLVIPLLINNNFGNEKSGKIGECFFGFFSGHESKI